MYCVDERSWRVGSANASARYSENDSTRRLRVKSSRTAAFNSSSVSFTGGGTSATAPPDRFAHRSDLTLVSGDGDRHRLLLRMAAVLLTNPELEDALDLVAARLVRGRLDREREPLLGQRRRVALVLVAATGGHL